MDLVESYRDEWRFARKPIGRTMLVLLLVGLAVLPWWAPRAWLTRGAVVWLYAIGALGQNPLIGSAGQLSFGQAGLLAIGAYSFGHLRIAGVPFPPALIASGLAAGLAGGGGGFPSLAL